MKTYIIKLVQFNVQFSLTKIENSQLKFNTKFSLCMCVCVLFSHIIQDSLTTTDLRYIFTKRNKFTYSISLNLNYLIFKV